MTRKQLSPHFDPPTERVRLFRRFGSVCMNLRLVHLHNRACQCQALMQMEHEYTGYLSQPAIKEKEPPDQEPVIRQDSGESTGKCTDAELG